MSKVTIIDSIMGSGKTTQQIERMQNMSEQFIYITPTLTEVKRILDLTTAFEPEVRNGGSKSVQLEQLILSGYNIASTHSLFALISAKNYEKLANYHLILDEAITPFIKIEDITRHDVKMLEDYEYVNIDEDGIITFTEKTYEGKWDKLKQYCDNLKVRLVGNSVIMSELPMELFNAFKTVTILTYNFKGCLLYPYFQMYNIPFDIKTNENEKLEKEKIKNLLNVYEGPANSRYSGINSLSKNNIRKLSNPDINSLRQTTANIFDRNFNTSSIENAFTTFKDYTNSLKGKGYAKGYISLTSKGTNDYADKKSMAYLANFHYNSVIYNWIHSQNVEFDKEQWSLNEMIQWLWRGCIRKGEPMNVFMPSKRMRNLLKNWLNN
jgi:hypothetical protein